MKLKELQSLLQDVRPFECAKAELEQYPTGPHLAACMLYTIENAHGDIEGKTVIDLGSGTGMLSIGCALLGASHVLGLEIDQDAIEVALDNVDQYEDPLPIDFVRCDVTELLGESHTAPSAPQPTHNTGHRRHGKDTRSRTAHKPTRHTRRRAATPPTSEEEESDHSQQGTDTDTDADTDADTDLTQGQLQGENEILSHSEDREGGTASVGGAGGQQEAGGGSQQQGPGSAAALPGHAACLPARAWHEDVLSRLQADTVVLNPPFGTKANKGIDMVFLKTAFKLCRGCVYSQHKSSTRSHIHSVAMKQLGAREAKVLAELRYDLPATMKFHKQKSVDIEVDLWRFVVGDATADG